MEDISLHLRDETQTQSRVKTSGDDVDKKSSVLSGERELGLRWLRLLRPINRSWTNHQSLRILTAKYFKRSPSTARQYQLFPARSRIFLQDLTDKTYEFKNTQVKRIHRDVQYHLEKSGRRQLAAIIQQLTELKACAAKSESIKCLSQGIKVTKVNSKLKPTRLEKTFRPWTKTISDLRIQRGFIP